MNVGKRKALDTKIEEALEASSQALQRAGAQLAKSYYAGLEKLREEGRVEGYVKLNFRARPRGEGLELAWYNRHTQGGAKGFQSITKPRGKSDYSLTILRGQGLPGMEDLIDRIEGDARRIREASRRLIEARTCFEVIRSRMLDCTPEVIAAINNQASSADGISAAQQFLDFDINTF